MHRITKRIMTTVAALALVVVLGVCLTACGNSNKSNSEINDYEARLIAGGYAESEIEVYQGENLKGMVRLPEGFSLSDFEWVITANNGKNSGVVIHKLTSEEKAQTYSTFMKEKNDNVESSTLVVERAGQVIFSGPQSAVNIARGRY